MRETSTTDVQQRIDGLADYFCRKIEAESEVELNRKALKMVQLIQKNLEKGSISRAKYNAALFHRFAVDNLDWDNFLIGQLNYLDKHIPRLKA